MGRKGWNKLGNEKNRDGGGVRKQPRDSYGGKKMSITGRRVDKREKEKFGEGGSKLLISEVVGESVHRKGGRKGEYRWNREKRRGRGLMGEPLGG